MLSIVLTYSYISFYLHSLFVRLRVLAAEKDFVFFKLLSVVFVSIDLLSSEFVKLPLPCLPKKHLPPKSALTRGWQLQSSTL